MPISIIILGIAFIFLIFGLGYEFIKELHLDRFGACLLILLTVIFLVIKPININDIAYLSIGGFIIILSFAVYLMTQIKQQNSYYKLLILTLLLLTLLLIFNLVLRFDIEQVFIFPTVLMGIVLGGFAYFSGENLTTDFVAIIISSNLFNVFYFIINYSSGIDIKLLLGVGVIFEASIVAMLTTILLFIVLKNYKTKIVDNKDDVLSVIEESLIKNDKEEVKG